MASIYAKGRDNARTPMQWDATENAGFTKGVPWIKVNPNYKEINAASQTEDKTSVYHYYKRLIALRKKYDVFVDGHFRMLLEEDENIFAYLREAKEQNLLVICNFYEKTIQCPLEDLRRKGTLLITNYKGTEDDSILRPYEARIYLLEK